MGMQYQQRDWEVVDYHEYLLTDGFYARGPALSRLQPNRYIVCIGAAQTFGCFCENPYPSLIQQRLAVPVLNLGRAGAGPKFFLRHPMLMQHINNARLAIVQIMSGRSEDNSAFISRGLEWLTRLSDGRELGAEQAYKELLEYNDTDFVSHTIRETRSNWICSFHHLLEAIVPPTLLFWFSRRGPAYVEQFTDVHSLFGQFPQLVNDAMVSVLRPLCDEYVECVSGRGMPQLLKSRFDGRPVRVNFGRQGEEPRTSSYNSYYPSPEMHEDAATSLQPICLKYL